MRRKNIYKSKLGTERAEHSTEILPVYSPQQSTAPLLRVKCSERYATCRHGWWKQQRRAEVWPGVCVAGSLTWLSNIYQLGARELLQNRNMKFIDIPIVNDAICHCDEAESLLPDRCEVRWCSESGRAGQGTRSSTRTSVLLFPRWSQQTNKLRSRAYFSTK